MYTAALTYPAPRRIVSYWTEFALRHLLMHSLACTSNIGDCSSWLQTAPNGPFDAIQAYVFYYGWAQIQSLMSTLYVTTSLTEGQISVATTDIASVSLSYPKAAFIIANHCIEIWESKRRLPSLG